MTDQALQDAQDQAMTLKDVMEFAPSQALLDVIGERQRQQTVEGWTTAHDDEHDAGKLAGAGSAYALEASNRLSGGHGISSPIAYGWPYEWYEWWKPKDPRSNLVRAAALLLAEIERIDRNDRASA